MTEFINVTKDDPVVKHVLDTCDKTWLVKSVELIEPAIIIDKHAPRKTLELLVKDPSGKEHKTSFNYLKAKRKLEQL